MNQSNNVFEQHFFLNSALLLPTGTILNTVFHGSKSKRNCKKL